MAFMKNSALITQNQIDLLIEAAQEVVKKAYAPYSKFQVGAAILTKQGNIFTGCNVENASYGLCICAERNAIASGVTTEGGDVLEILAIAIANNRQIPCSPCGACRQVIQEFGANAKVIFRDLSGWQITSIKDLLPQGFSL